VLRRLPSRRPARRVALRDADGAHGVKAAPLPKIEPRLRGATVGDTTFGPVAEGARRQDVRNNEADVKSKRGDGPSSWIFGSEDEDMRRPGDTSVVTRSNQWAPRLRQSGRRGPPGVVGPSELYRTHAVIWKSRVRPEIFRVYDHYKGVKE
jgi:hypothetical protein